jgi:hypothetical protein
MYMTSRLTILICIRRLAAALQLCAPLAAWLAIAPAPVHAQQSSPIHIVVRLTARVAASSAKKGDSITASVVAPPNLKGDIVEGRIADAKSSGAANKESRLKLQFQRLAHQGRWIPINAEVTGFRNSAGQADVDEEGNVIRRSNGLGKMALLTAIAAGGGAAIGAANGNAARGAEVGALAGAAAGILLFTVGTKAPDIRFDAGSELDLQVSEAAAQ